MQLAKNWHKKLEFEFSKPYIRDLKNFLEKEQKSKTVVFPPESKVFYAFGVTPYEKVKVVIVGQDPYHGFGQAHGLSFSVPVGVRPPPSLQNIFKELKNDLGVPTPKTGSLISWAKQGVLLLNSTLTVREGEPKSHHGRGWEQFTDAVLSLLAERKKPIVFMLWGKSAKEKCDRVLSKTHHTVLAASHPSPFSAHFGFLGCRHFSKANKSLESWGELPINWRVN